jgi:O-antigen ligase
MSRPPRRNTKNVTSDDPERFVDTRLLNSERLWQVVSFGFGALVVLAFLVPVDAISVFAGESLPQNLGWLVLAVLAALAARTSMLALRLSALEIICISLAFCWLVGCTWWLSRTNDGRAVWNSFWQLMMLASCYYIGRALLQLPRTRSATLIILVVGCCGLAIDGLQQVMVTLPATRREFEKDPERILAENNIDAPIGSPRRKQFKDRLDSPEPFATFALANSLATLLSFGVVLTGGWFVTLLPGTKREDPKPPPSSIHDRMTIAALVAVLGLQLVCLLLTRSRAAYLALLAGLAIWIAIELLRSKRWLQGRGVRQGAIAVGACVAIAVVWMMAFDKRVLTEATKSLGYRIEYWQATLGMIRDHGTLGVGLGNFQSYYPFYKVEQASEVVADPHNWVLDIAASLSVPIAILMVAWAARTVAMGIRRCLVQGDELEVSALHPKDDSGHVRAEASAEHLDAVLAKRLLQGAGVGVVTELLFLFVIGRVSLQTALWDLVLVAPLGWILVKRVGSRPVAMSCLVAAVCSTLVALMVSGSWQASGIAIPFVCVCACMWGTKPATRTLSQPFRGTPSGGLWPVVVAIAGCLAFGLQSWQPVMQSWMLAVQAQSATSLTDQARLITQAAESDPLNRQFRLQLAQLYAAQADSAKDRSSFAEHARSAFQQIELAMALDLASPGTPKLAGQIALDLASSAVQLGLDPAEFLRASEGFYSQASQRYPSSVELQVQHALNLAMLGEWEQAAMAAENARLLSERIPHLDKKLESQQVWLPFGLPGVDSRLLASETVGQSWVRAEPLTEWLRNQNK